MPFDSQFDRIDRKIIEQLRINGRLSVSELARRVGLSTTPCRLRMQKLVESGCIRGFHAHVDFKMLGEGQVAFAEVKLTDTREHALKAFEARVREIAEVEECHMIAGSFDYLLKIRTSDISAYREVLGEKISVLPFVASTSSYVVMDSTVEQRA